MNRRVLTLMLVCALGGVASAQRPNQGEDESAAFVEEGRSALKKGDLDDASKSLDQAIALNPRRVEAYVLRSAVYAARKQYKEGIALMRRAQAIAPNDAEVLTALGTHHVLSGDVATGVPLLEQVVGREPARYDAQLLLGHHRHGAGKWPGAITALEAYFSARPEVLAREDARHRIELADAYLRNRQPAQALALFDKSVKAVADRKGAPLVKGSTELRARMGVAWATAAIDCKKARPLLRELDEIAEQHPEVWLVDGQCALALGDSKGALGLGRKYLDTTTNGSAAAHALVGEALPRAAISPRRARSSRPRASSIRSAAAGPFASHSSFCARTSTRTRSRHSSSSDRPQRHRSIQTGGSASARPCSRAGTRRPSCHGCRRPSPSCRVMHRFASCSAPRWCQPAPMKSR